MIQHDETGCAVLDEAAMLCISRNPIATFDCRPGLCPGAGLWTLVRRRRLGVREPCSRFCPGSHASRHHDGHQVLDVHRHRCFIPTMTHGSMFQWWRQGQQRHRPTPSMAWLLKAGAWLPHSTVRLHLAGHSLSRFICRRLGNVGASLAGDSPPTGRASVPASRLHPPIPHPHRGTYDAGCPFHDAHNHQVIPPRRRDHQVTPAT